MKLDNRLIMIIVAAVTLFMFPVAVFITGPFRIVVGFLCLILFPGYALLSVLLPKKEGWVILSAPS